MCRPTLFEEWEKRNELELWRCRGEYRILVRLNRLVWRGRLGRCSRARDGSRGAILGDRLRGRNAPTICLRKLWGFQQWWWFLEGEACRSRLCACELERRFGRIPSTAWSRSTSALRAGLSDDISSEFWYIYLVFEFCIVLIILLNLKSSFLLSKYSYILCVRGLCVEYLFIHLDRDFRSDLSFHIFYYVCCVIMFIQYVCHVHLITHCAF